MGSFCHADRQLRCSIGECIISWLMGSVLIFSFQAREFVAGPPSLEDVIALLDKGSDTVPRSDLFNVSRNSENFESFDYAALGHHVEVLGRVLMNIPQYVLSEKVEIRSAQENGSSPRHPGKEPSKLEKIKGLLERLGYNIGTRP